MRYMTVILLFKNLTTLLEPKVQRFFTDYVTGLYPKSFKTSILPLFVFHKDSF